MEVGEFVIIPVFHQSAEAGGLEQVGQTNHGRGEPPKPALPQLSCSGTGASGSVEHPLAEPIEFRAAIALALQACQCRDLAFDLPIAVRQLARGLPRGVLAL